MPPKMESLTSLNYERNVLEKSMDELLTEISSFTCVDDEDELFTRNTKVQIKNFIRELEDMREQLEALNNKIKPQIADDDEEAMTDEADRAQGLQRKIKKKLIALQSELEEDEAARKRMEMKEDRERQHDREDRRSVADISSLSTPHAPRPPPLIPVKLQEFNGDPLQWPEFWNNFSSQVDTQQDYTDLTKLNHLRSVLKGTPHEILSGFSGDGSSYTAAKDILKARYDKPQAILHARLKNIIDSPVASHNTFIKVFDQVEHEFRKLDALDDHNGGTINYREEIFLVLLKSKIPKDIWMNFNELRDKEWTLSDLRTRIQQRVDVMREGATDLLTENSENNRPLFREQANFNRQYQDAPYSVPRCAFCLSVKHKSISCWNMKPPDKVKYLRQRKLCFKCFNRHPSGSCHLRQCSICQGDHSDAICEAISKQRGTVNSNQYFPNSTSTMIAPVMDQDEEEEYDMTAQEQQDDDPGQEDQWENNNTPTMIAPAVNQESLQPEKEGPNPVQTRVPIMPLVSTKIKHPVTNKSVSIHLAIDNCSGRSYITQSAVKELGLKPIRHETYNSGHFGTNQSQPTTSAVVEVALHLAKHPQKKWDRVELTVIPDITTKVTQFPLDQDKYPVLKSAVEADQMNDLVKEVQEVELQVLLGAPDYAVFVSPNSVRLDKTLVMLETDFGMVPMGCAPIEKLSIKPATSTTLCCTTIFTDFSVPSLITISSLSQRVCRGNRRNEKGITQVSTDKYLHQQQEDHHKDSSTTTGHILTGSDSKDWRACKSWRPRCSSAGRVDPSGSKVVMGVPDQQLSHVSCTQPCIQSSQQCIQPKQQSQGARQSALRPVQPVLQWRQKKKIMIVGETKKEERTKLQSS